LCKYSKVTITTHYDVHINTSYSSQQQHLQSPLLPYTTLFRSPRLSTARKSVETGSNTTPVGKFAEALLLPLRTGAVPEMFTTSSDRKSTRLNSSHGSISYAVFCLRKKIYQGWGQEVGM